MSNESDFISAGEAAKLLGLSRQRIWVLLKSGQLRGFMADQRAWVIRRSDAEVFRKVKRPNGVSIDQRKHRQA